MTAWMLPSSRVRRDTRNHSTSIGGDVATWGNPAASRVRDERPSAPTVSSARWSASPEAVRYRTPRTTPPSRMRSVTSALMRS